MGSPPPKKATNASGKQRKTFDLETKSAEHLAEAFASSPVPTAIIAGSGTLLRANAAFLTAMSSTEADIHGKPAAKLFRSINDVDLKAELARLFNQPGEDYRLPVEVGAEGEVENFTLVAAKVKSSNGAPPTAILHLLEDHSPGISTDLVRERDSESQRKFLRQIIDTSPNFVFAKDREGRFKLVNKAVAEAYGTSIKELIGKTDADFNDDADQVAAFLRDDLEVMDSLQEKIVIEEPITTAAGELRWLQTVKRPIIDEKTGRATHVLGISVDITARKQAEEELRNQKSFLRQILDINPSYIFAKDRGGRYTLLNQAVADSYQTTVEALLGKTDSDFNRNENDVARFRRDDMYVIRSKEELFIREERVLDIHGNTQWLQTVKRPIVDESGEATHVVGVATDITRLKRAERELRDHVAALESSIDGMAILSESGDYLYLNQAHAEIYGYDRPEDLIGKTWDVLYYPDEVERFNKLFQSKDWKSEGTWRGESIGKRRDGSTFVNEVSLTALENGGLVCVVRNITQRKRAELALRDSEQTLRALLENVPDTILTVDREGKIIYINKTVKQTTVDEVVGQRAYEFIQPSEQSSYLEHLESVFSAGESVEFQTTSVYGDRYDVRMMPFRRNDKVVAALLIATDVTEKAKAEEAIRQSQERYRTFADNIIAGFWHTDAADRTIYLNPAMCKLLGIESADELEGKTYRDFFTEESIRTIDAEHHKRLAGISSTYEAELVGSDGIQTPVLVSGAPLFSADGELESYIATVADVSDLKSVEEALKQSEQRYSTFAENINVGFWHGTLDGATLYVNRAMVEMLELDSADELSGVAYTEFIAPECLEDVEVEHEKRFRGETSTYELTIVGRHGTRRNMVVTATPLMSGKEDVESVMATFADVTEAKLAEAERKNLEAKVQQAQKMESLGVLAGGIAHDFNNLLMGVLGNAGLALMELDAESGPGKRIDQIRKAAQRAAELTRQLLAYSGKGKFSVQHISISELVHEMGGLLETVISKKAKLSYEFENDIPAVEADTTQIRQVIMNLITNASDSLGEDQGEIWVKTRLLQAKSDEFLDACIGQDLPAGPYVLFEVQDSGCGMAEETIEKIFDPFFTTKFKGHGLGLAAVLGIVRSHRGAVKVSSSSGEGTTFSIYLPAVEETEPVSSTRETLSIEDWRGSGKFLVVDDEESVRDVAVGMLEKFGFEVITADGGREGVKKLLEFADELTGICLDMTMPDLSGEETYREIRRIRKDVPVLFSSGYSEQAVSAMLKDDPLTSFIQKPYGPLALVERIRDLLESSEAHSEEK